MQPEIQCFGHYAGGFGLNQIDQFGHGITVKELRLRADNVLVLSVPYCIVIFYHCAEYWEDRRYSKGIMKILE